MVCVPLKEKLQQFRAVEMEKLIIFFAKTKYFLQAGRIWLEMHVSREPFQIS